MRNEKIVKVLLQHGADVRRLDALSRNVVEACGTNKSLLSVPQMFGGSEVQGMLKSTEDRSALDELKRYGYDPENPSTNKDKALLTSAKYGIEPAVRILLERGADINAVGEYHGTALWLAVEGGHEKLARLLLNKKADTSVQHSVNGDTVLHAASAKGNDALVKLLLQHDADPTARNTLECTPLHSAARLGHDTVVSYLLDAGSDAVAKDKEGTTPLFLAISHKREKAARLLLDRRTHSSKTLQADILHHAVSTQDELFVQLLLDNGIAVNGTSRGRSSALHQAVSTQKHDDNKNAA
jgi:ankyrin repeat protein